MLNVNDVVASVPGSSVELRPGSAAASASPAQLPAPAAAPAPSSAPVTQSQVQAAVQQIQKFLAESSRTIEFRIDDASGVPVVTVRDASSGDVIRQIPNEETLHLAQMLKENGSANHALVSLTV